MSARCWPPERATFETAARHWVAGGLVGMPTETVYGLAADADNPTAVARIFSAKGRPSDHPLIVHIPAPEAPGEAAWQALVGRYAHDVPPFAWALMQAFWPGPLTLILHRREGVATAAAGGHASVGLRCPEHPTAQALLLAAQRWGVWGVAAPSANRFGRVSPTTAEHVASEFEALSEAELIIVDGGACSVGIESTIVDATRGEPVLLRPGMITAQALSQACGLPVRERDAQAPCVSGSLASHYAPQARVRLADASALSEALRAEPEPARVAVYAQAGVAVPADVRVERMPDDAATCAHDVFAVLRRLDAPDCHTIWVQTPPEGQDWDGVRDRLQRAAA
ncbi:SUA5 Putative translation factor (SUA5) [Burkholderiaceae bacterium]